MEKFSLYDFLTYLLPGFVLAEGIRLILSACGFAWYPKLSEYHFNDIELGLIGLSISLVLGICVQALTAAAVKKSRRYRKMFYEDAQKIIMSSRNLEQIREGLNQLSIEETNEKIGQDKNSSKGKFFKNAIQQLEVAEKMGVAKAFQGIYFFMRNLASVAILLIVPLALALGWSIYHATGEILQLKFAFIICIIAAVLCCLAAKYCRHKMVTRACWQYYILRTASPFPFLV
jgi:hypothetical protein